MPRILVPIPQLTATLPALAQDDGSAIDAARTAVEAQGLALNADFPNFDADGSGDIDPASSRHGPSAFTT